MMYKLGVQLKKLKHFELFIKFLKMYPKVIFDSVTICFTKKNYLLVNSVVKLLQESYMTTNLGIPLDKFLKVKCSTTLDIENCNILYISKQNFSQYGLIDQNNRLEIVDAVYLTFYYKRKVFDIDCK